MITQLFWMVFMNYKDTDEPAVWNESVWKKENKFLPKKNKNLEDNFVKKKIA